jgi:hypothetical protein
MTPTHLRLTAAAITMVLASPSASGQQAAKPPKTNVWMDVATHSMAGMPEIGGMGKMAMGMFGGSAMQNSYGATRFGAMPGRYVDIAMLNTLNPGAEAEDAIPDGLKLGKSLPLVPPKAEVRDGPSGEMPHDRMRDAKARILIYWGCGSVVRPGQPKEIRIDVKDGQAKVSGSMSGRYAPDRTASVGPSYALWPNERQHKSVPEGASLVGDHRITGDKVPESLAFTLTQMQDFMPKIALETRGTLADGQTLQWQAVDRARGYFLQAMGQQDDAVVLWSSAETADAGTGIFDYLPGATVDKWIKDKVLLNSSATSCAIPKGIFASAGDRGGGGVLRMIAFGPESNIAYPPRPANPKTPWVPEWNVRVRVKSTTTAMLGMPVNTNDEQQDGDKPKRKRNLLRGLLGG